MRQPAKNIIKDTHSKRAPSNHGSVDFSDSRSYCSNILDRAFVLYSDEDVFSVSSHSQLSNLSFGNRSVSFSQADDPLQFRSQRSQANTIGNFINNQESSIHDARESQCSQSGKELFQAFQPLFQQSSFRRRSPRFTTYEQTTQKQAIKKSKENNFQMIEDEKSQLVTQPTQILEEKEEHSMIKKNNQKQNKIDKIEEQSFRMTRSKTHQNIEANYNKGHDTTLDDSQLPKDSSSRDYLSRITKDFLLAARKQKKIKKAQRDKSMLLSQNSKRVHHNYSLRRN